LAVFSSKYGEASSTEAGASYQGAFNRTSQEVDSAFAEYFSKRFGPEKTIGALLPVGRR
jgi:hypothetical protein